ncbi:MAG: tRNA-binding protein [Methylococcales symbiont of Iophon sp. n. MRB-2018]|nr:MAG: tRNA-binding protein [Methylococcales symbiont of Iophon sp. n. MRB-2018]KAF3979251.1 MAG: tRNA-binding protein [Methylococcales symbiont of Iophon sp. n. MRB-2018]
MSFGKNISQEITFEDFLNVDIRAGTIVSATTNLKAKKPAYVLDIDFGYDIGIKKSSAQLTENYTEESLIGKQICAVMNFPPRRVAGVKSEVLVLAIICKDTGTVLMEPSMSVTNGERLA